MKISIGIENSLIHIEENNFKNDNHIKEIASKVDGFSQNIDIINAKCQDYEWSNKLHSELISVKAEKTDLKKVERMLAHYVPLHMFKDLKSSLVEYTKNDEFEVAQRNIIEMKEILDRKAYSIDLKNKVADLLVEINK